MNTHISDWLSFPAMLLTRDTGTLSQNNAMLGGKFLATIVIIQKQRKVLVLEVGNDGCKAETLIRMK
jgi:hypothetical protein